MFSFCTTSCLWALLWLFLAWLFAWLFWKLLHAPKLEQLRKERDQAVADYNKINSDYKLLLAQNQKLEDEHSGLRIQFNDLSTLRDDLSLKLRDAEKQNDDHLASIKYLELFRGKYEDANSKLEDANAKIADYDTRYGNLELKLGKTESDRLALAKELEDLRVRFATLEGDKLKLAKELEDLKAKLLALETDKGDLGRQLKEIDLLVIAQKETIAELESVRDKYNALLAESDNHKSAYAGLAANFDTLQANFNSLQSDNTGLLGKLATGDEETNRLKAEIARLTDELEALRNDTSGIDALNEELNGLKGKYNNLFVKHDALDIEFKEREETIRQLQGQLSQMNDHLIEKRKLNESYLAQIAELEGLKADFEKLRLAYDGDLAALKEQNARYGDLDEQLDIIKAEYEQLLDKNRSLEGELFNQKDIIETFQTNIIGLDDIVGNQKGVIETFQSNILLLQKDLEEERGKRSGLQAKLQALQGNLADLESEKDSKERELQAQLDAIRAKADNIDFERIGYAAAGERDDLQIIKGIGPFIEQKLNALGIYTFRQIANFTRHDEEKVTDAIEFFPGRIQRDEWVKQAIELLNDDLAYIRERAKNINFDRIGRATAADKDDLKEIHGIGPFFERKLNALGIYTFAQIANFTKEDEEKVTEAIEYFPGRIERDEWVKQAKELAGKG